MCKVSIIVPVCNVEKYLRECLESLINQTLKDIEIICINDGSKDHSLDILKEYERKDKRIYIIDKPNAGYGHTMNKGMDAAKGEYIGIVESDDFAAENMFESLYSLAIKHEADVVKSNYIAYRTEKKPWMEKIEPLWRCPYDQIFSPEVIHEVFTVQPCIWSAIYKRKLVIDSQIRFNETPGAAFQDTAFAFKIWTCAQRIYFTKEAFLYYRSDNENSSVQSSAKVYCICDEFKEMERHLERLPEKKAWLYPLLMWLKLREYKWNYGRLSEQFKYEFVLKMKNEFESARGKGYLDSEWISLEERKEIDEIIDYTDIYYQKTCKNN